MTVMLPILSLSSHISTPKRIIMDFTTDTTIITLLTGPNELGFQVIDRNLHRIYRRTLTLSSDELGVFRYIGGLPVATQECIQVMKSWETSNKGISILYKANSCDIQFDILDGRCPIHIHLPQERTGSNSSVKDQSTLIHLSKQVEHLKHILSITKTDDIPVFRRIATRLTIIGTELIPRNTSSLHILHPRFNIVDGNSEPLSGKEISIQRNATSYYFMKNTRQFNISMQYYMNNTNYYVPIQPSKHLIIPPDAKGPNSIQTVIDDLDQLSHLSHLLIGGFTTTTTFQFPPIKELKSLILSQCTMEIFPDLNEAFPNLKELFLYRCTFDDQSNTSFSKMKHLKTLALIRSNIEHPHLSGVTIIKS